MTAGKTRLLDLFCGAGGAHEAIQSPRVWPELFLYPVYSDVITMRPIRWFGSYSEAVDFVSENLGRINLYVGEPKRRKRA